MGNKLFVVGVTIMAGALALSLGQPFLIAGFIVMLVGCIAVVLDK